MKLHKQEWVNLDQRKSIFLRKKCFQTQLKNQIMIPQCLWSFCIRWCFMDMKLVSLQKNWRICDVPLHLLSLKLRVDKKILRTHKIPIWQSFYDIVVSQYFIWAEYFFSYFKCFINCVEYHIPVSSTSCCSLLTKGEFPLLLKGCSLSNLTVNLWIS